MALETLLFEVRDAVGIITINRPGCMNAMCEDMLRELSHLLDECETDDGVKAVVLTGGPKFFCAGGDIAEMLALGSLADSYLPTLVPAVFAKLEGFNKPTIAAMSGAAMGGGLETALCCDLRVASESAKFALPEVKIGMIPGGGGTQRLSRLVGPGAAKRIMMTGDVVDAAEAYRIGLVDFIAPVEGFLDKAFDLAVSIASRAPLAVRAIKDCVNTGLQMDLESGLKYERQWAVRVGSSEDQREGFRAFVEKRKPVFRGQ